MRFTTISASSVLHLDIGHLPIHHGQRAEVAGISGPVEQGDGRDDVGRLEQVPAGKSLLRTGADGAGEDVVLRQLAVQKRAEHV